MTPPANDLLDLRAHIGHVASRVEWELLSPTMDPIDTLHPFPGATVQVDTRARILRTCRGFKLTANDARKIDPFRHRIRPTWVLEDGTRWPLGAFIVGNPTRDLDAAHVTVGATLMDLGWTLDQKITEPFGIPTGGAIWPAIVDLVESAGVFNPAIDVTDQRVGPPANWPIGTLRSRILDELCTLAGYLRIYFDNDGVCRGRASTPLVAGTGHRYDLVGDVRIKAIPAPQTSANLVEAPNVYVVVGNGPTVSPVVGVAYVDPNLPHSRENRDGLEVPEVVTMQALVDSTQAQRVAEGMADADPNQFEQVRFTSPPDPRHDIFDQVDFAGGPWREAGWLLPLEPGADHSHELTRKAVEFG